MRRGSKVLLLLILAGGLAFYFAEDLLGLVRGRPGEWPVVTPAVATATDHYLTGEGSRVADVLSIAGEVATYEQKIWEPQGCQALAEKLGAVAHPDEFLILAAETPDPVLAEVALNLQVAMRNLLGACLAEDATHTTGYAEQVSQLEKYVRIRRAEIAGKSDAA